MTENIIHVTEKITGTNLSGNSSDVNRTYTVSEVPKSGSLFVIVENAVLQNVDFSLNGQVVKFKNKVFNSQNITIMYVTS